jgi:hypothetical protein
MLIVRWIFGKIWVDFRWFLFEVSTGLCKFRQLIQKSFKNAKSSGLQPAWILAPRPDDLDSFGFAFNNIDKRRKYHDVFRDAQQQKIFCASAGKHH